MSKEAGSASAPDAANRRWKRLTPLLLVLVGFGAGVLAGHHGPSLRRHRGGGDEQRLGQRGDRVHSPGRRRAGVERARARDRDSRAREVEGERLGRRLRQELTRRLDLDETQQRQVEAFIEANRAEARAFWDETYRRYRELRRHFREQIREILTDAQHERFDSWVSERERNGREPGSVEGSPGGPGQ